MILGHFCSPMVLRLEAMRNSFFLFEETRFWPFVLDISFVGWKMVLIDLKRDSGVRECFQYLVNLFYVVVQNIREDDIFI